MVSKFAVMWISGFVALVSGGAKGCPQLQFPASVVLSLGRPVPVADSVVVESVSLGSVSLLGVGVADRSLLSFGSSCPLSVSSVSGGWQSGNPQRQVR
ncbi:MAG: hypothetical protein WBD41_25405 [Rhodococcus sp. (in: high G+C Gram-positive bacteria)]